MSEDSDSSYETEILQVMLDELTDDTEEQMMMEIVEEGESSNRRKHKRKYISREREVGHGRLFNDYFFNEPVYTDEMFRRRFRMSKELFLRIVEALSYHSEYFRMRVDAAGQNGLSPLQKCTAAIRQLAYGTPADHYDEYLRIGETTAVDCVKNFCRSMIEVFGPVYFRRPNAHDIQRLLQAHSDIHGFPGMLGSIDCMHWPWKNCPVAWRGQFTRGSNNDINVLNQSPLFNDVLQRYSPHVQFMLNGSQYTKGYYLADAIYPEWAVFVKSFSYPEDHKRKKFKEMQEAARKDVELAFGVLQSRWTIIRGAGRFWHMNVLTDIMYACIILHNMIVENEGNAISNWYDEEAVPPVPASQGPDEEFQQYLRRNSELRDREVHHNLRADLIEHVWERFGDNNNEN